MPRHVSLKHYMLNKPITIQSDATIFEAAHQILRHKVSGVCVVDKKYNLLGMLSEMDCLRAIVNRMYIGGEDHAGTVAEVMTTEVMCNAPGDDIDDGPWLRKASSWGRSPAARSSRRSRTSRRRQIHRNIPSRAGFGRGGFGGARCTLDPH